MIHGQAFELTPWAAAPLAIIDVQMLVIKGFAVAGGAAVGYVVSGWIIQLLGRLAFHRKVPLRVVAVIRLLGMAALGILVYLWVFGNSTAGGLGGGGGWWPFGGKAGQGDKTGPNSSTPEQPKADEQPKEQSPNVLEHGRTLQIRLL